MRHDEVAGQAKRCSCGAGHLTTRQIEILRLAATGLSSDQIAAQLSISSRTVDDHLGVMYRRTQARQRSELVARAYAAGILASWPPRWSGKHCLRAWMPENDVGNCRILQDSRFRDNASGWEQAGAPGETAPVGADVLTGVLVGYARQSGRDQDLSQQITPLRAIGCRSIFVDKLSGKDREHRELRRLLGGIRPGDTLVVASMDRVACSLQELIWLVAELRRRRVGLKALRENLDTTAPGGSLIFDVFTALAEFLRGLVSESTHRGLAAARVRGRTGGRPTVMTAEKIAAARELLPENSMAAIARKIGVSRGTLYAHMEAITREVIVLTHDREAPLSDLPDVPVPRAARS